MTEDEMREMIDALFDKGNLSKWEDSFLVSLTAQLDNGHRLTERQEEKLQEIHRDKV